MRKFLTLKHWQLFLLLMGVPIIGEIIIMTMVIVSRDFFHLFNVLLIQGVISCALFFAWLYSMGTNLFKKLPVGAGMSLARFKLFLFIPLVYIGSVCLLMPLLFSNATQFPNALVAEDNQVPGAFFLIVPIHLFSMFCMFYCLYFNSKALRAAELQRPVVFSDYAGEFLLLWFFPIGIWVIQPRINRLFEDLYTGRERLD